MLDSGWTYNARIQQSDEHGVRRFFEGFSLRVNEFDNVQVCCAYLRAEESAVMSNQRVPGVGFKTGCYVRDYVLRASWESHGQKSCRTPGAWPCNYNWSMR